MKSVLLFLFSFLITFIFFNHSGINQINKTTGDDEKFSGAMQSLDFRCRIIMESDSYCYYDN